MLSLPPNIFPPHPTPCLLPFNIPRDMFYFWSTPSSQSPRSVTLRACCDAAWGRRYRGAVGKEATPASLSPCVFLVWNPVPFAASQGSNDATHLPSGPTGALHVISCFPGFLMPLVTFLSPVRCVLPKYCCWFCFLWFFYKSNSPQGLL